MEDESRPPRIGVLGGDGLWSLTEVLRGAGVEVVDLEPGPKTMAAEVARRWHYGRASVRAGLLGAPADCLALLRQADEGLPEGWMRLEGGLAFDPWREVDPEGLPPDLATPYRQAHLAAVRRLAGAVDRLILPLCKISLPINQMRADLEAVSQHLRRANPALVVQIALLPSLTDQADPVAVEVALRGLLDVPGVVHDPLFDALVLRVLGGGTGGRLLAHLAAGHDPDAFGGAVPEPAPDRSDRKDRREKRKKNKGQQAKVVCEDELLEAFAK